MYDPSFAVGDPPSELDAIEMIRASVVISSFIPLSLAERVRLITFQVTLVQTT